MTDQNAYSVLRQQLFTTPAAGLEVGARQRFAIDGTQAIGAGATSTIEGPPLPEALLPFALTRGDAVLIEYAAAMLTSDVAGAVVSNAGLSINEPVGLGAGGPLMGLGQPTFTTFAINAGAFPTVISFGSGAVALAEDLAVAESAFGGAGLTIPFAPNSFRVVMQLVVTNNAAVVANITYRILFFVRHIHGLQEG